MVARAPRPLRTPEPSSEELRRSLRDAGLRATAPRLAVLRSLSAATGPVSHGEVAGDLAGEGWDRATVYRNLIALTDAGLLRRTDLGDHTWRFELQREQAAGEAIVHPHFLCDACGDVTCLPDSAVQVVAARGTPRAIQRQRYEVQIKGRCDRCD
jgi:Fur family ferric uptake transcriptional regulator